MKQIHVTIRRKKESYTIVIENEVSKKLPALLKKNHKYTSYVILTDTNVQELYAREFENRMRHEGLDIVSIVIPAGEKSKKLSTVEKILDKLHGEKLEKDTCMLCMGGGVIGDMGGFAASLYLRGIDFIHIPTTLLAQVDASIGGKTGVNTAFGKNLIGTITQPKAVYIDPVFLTTLPNKEFTSGMAEVIKTAIIGDKTLYRLLHTARSEIQKRDIDTLKNIIERTARLKARIVSKNPHESGLRMILNYGHTLGHAIEKVSHYKIPHGYAVAIGIHLVNTMAVKKGMLSSKRAIEIKKLITSYKLPTSLPSDLSYDEILEHTVYDKKKRRGQVNWIAVSDIGEPHIIHF